MSCVKRRYSFIDFDIATLLADISQVFTLEEGDVS